MKKNMLLYTDDQLITRQTVLENFL